VPGTPSKKVPATFFCLRLFLIALLIGAPHFSFLISHCKKTAQRFFYTPSGPAQPEADIVVPVIRIVVVPIRRTQVLTVVVPTPAPLNTVSAGGFFFQPLPYFSVRYQPPLSKINNKWYTINRRNHAGNRTTDTEGKIIADCII